MSGGQEKNFSTLGPKLRVSKAQQDYGDKQRQICIELIDYRMRSGEWRRDMKCCYCSDLPCHKSRTRTNCQYVIHFS